MAQKPFPLAKAYRLLESGPVVLVTTARDGRANAMPLAWHTMIDFAPPLVGIVLSGENFSCAALRATRECVLNIPPAEIGKKVVACGSCSGRKIDKFKKFGLTPVPAAKVRAPRVQECYASLECRVVDARMAKKYDLYVLEVVQAWVDPAVRAPRTLHHLGGDLFMVAGRQVHLKPRAK